jgi:hypothetical protein
MSNPDGCLLPSTFSGKTLGGIVKAEGVWWGSRFNFFKKFLPPVHENYYRDALNI